MMESSEKADAFCHDPADTLQQERPDASLDMQDASGNAQMQTDSSATSNSTQPDTVPADETMLNPESEPELPPARPNADRPIIKMSVDLLKTFNLINDVRRFA
jgi:hypothetical protein